MKDHTLLRKAVVIKMQSFQLKQVQPTAREIYNEIIQESAIIARRYNFKSFSRLMPSVKKVKGMTPCRGKVMTYMLK